MAQNIRQNIIINAIDKTGKGFQGVANNVNSLEHIINRVQANLVNLFAAGVIVNSIPNLIKLTDKAVLLSARLKIASSSTEDFNLAQKALLRISLAAGTSLEANTILYTRIIKPLKVLGLTAKDTVKFTEGISSSLKLNGATAHEASSALLQLSQALASGVLRGEEFNAVFEAAPLIIESIAQGMGVAVGSMRTLASEGKLTADVVVQAFLKQTDEINAQAKLIPLTIGRAWENVKSKMLAMATVNTGMNESIAKFVNYFNTDFDKVISVLGTVLTLLAVKMTSALLRLIGTYSKLAIEQSLAQAAAARLLKLELYRQQVVDAGARKQAILVAKQNLQAAKLAA